MKNEEAELSFVTPKAEEVTEKSKGKKKRNQIKRVRRTHEC